MSETLYRFLKWTAITLAVAWLGWSLYDSFVIGRNPGDSAYHEANILFEDGYYDRALDKYENALRQAPDHIHARRGRARTLLQLGRFPAALQEFNAVIAMQPKFAAAYANRAVLYDRMGNYQQAIEDYEQALALDPELARGPHWLTRFLRLQAEKPPTIADRARYLREQLALPKGERLLRLPAIDATQRTYKQ